MAIPLATTTIEVKGVRPESGDDPAAEGYGFEETPPLGVVTTGVRACISGPNARRGVATESGQPSDESDTWQLRADPCDLRKDDLVKDLVTGVTYHVETVVQSKIVDYKLQHTHAQLFVVSGLPS